MQSTLQLFSIPYFTKLSALLQILNSFTDCFDFVFYCGHLIRLNAIVGALCAAWALLDLQAMVSLVVHTEFSELRLLSELEILLYALVDLLYYLQIVIVLLFVGELSLLWVESERSHLVLVVLFEGDGPTWKVLLQN